jgi:hypothetical protein
MRFMLIVKATPKSEAGAMPSEKALNAMTKFNEELSKAGVLLDLSGLQASSKGARVRFQGGKRTVVDGPFAEAKELVAGYWVLSVKSKDEAIEWARRAPMDIDGDDAEIEIRPFFELEDFEEFAELDRARKIGEDLAKKK